MSDQPPPPSGYYQQPYGYQPPPPTPGNATTALILGIVGMVFCGAFTAVPAWIIGRRAIREIDASRGRLGGRGVAQAGYILGIIGTVISLLVLLAIIVIVVIGVSVGSDTSNNIRDLCNDLRQDNYATDC